MRLSIKLLLRDFGLNMVAVDSSLPLAKAWFIETLRNNARHNNKKTLIRIVMIKIEVIPLPSTHEA